MLEPITSYAQFKKLPVGTKFKVMDGVNEIDTAIIMYDKLQTGKNGERYTVCKHIKYTTAGEENDRMCMQEYKMYNFNGVGRQWFIIN